VEPLRALILLLHPVAAIAVIAWMVRQHRWRQRSTLLKGEARKSAVADHERDGNRLYFAIWLVVGLGFAANIWQRSTVEGATGLATLLPAGSGGLHAGGGILALILVTFLWRIGRRTAALRDAGEPWAQEKMKHGRASDVILVLAAIHAFLGFLWLMQLLV